ncbi:hypothetical protein Csa_021529 [Cucumis sativus]|nr:hypothetical protein Csa_021529 [Cucumis sativus]
MGFGWKRCISNLRRRKRRQIESKTEEMRRLKSKMDKVGTKWMRLESEMEEEHWNRGGDARGCTRERRRDAK